MRGFNIIYVVLAIFILITVFIMGCYIALGIFLPQTSIEKQEERIYVSEKKSDEEIYVSNYGFSFAYPRQYFIEDRELGEFGNYFYATILTHTNPKEIPKDSEGPISITIIAYPNKLGFTAETWVKGSAESNWKLTPDNKLIETEIDEVSGLRYRWSGLYEADNVVIAHSDYIYSFVVTWISEEDQIRKDFEALLTSVRWNGNIKKTEFE